MLLKDKTVIITGASRGIGRAAALECARQGGRVVAAHSGSAQGHESAASLLKEIEAFGGQAIQIGSDAADLDTGERLVDAAVEAFGSVDVFVNNAGICPFHSFLDMPKEVYLKTVNTNLNGAYFAVQAAANQMKRQGSGGAIIAVSSISALVGGGMQTHYTPTKAGLHSLMQSCAIALGPYGIRCNSVLPGSIATDINKDDFADPEKREYMVKRTPLGRLGEPHDIAGPIVFLASDMARYVTGAALLVDGGLFVNLQ
ncbi:SDR family oxidoreductase [Pseudomonas sp. TH05]|uniref:SDR family NAD(P)-dependent oxidoreductase n=1 Tax=unclassified Pseudomonas TaxID=196821 RepID=UPI0019118A18|nr:MULTISPECIES: SDR family NAD(P)-dependent oxidoreductase [unclassified Pseudomonas]MBK5538299.1 SDR family oxidoreductase [Pseudomonas sp. TH07]MBK5556720.1 SDR family oxidoreductase [Pseudomonas sp. TH05]